MLKKDHVIIDRLKAGDAAVIDDIVERYKDPLFAFIVRMVNSYDIAEEIFQETWVRVIRHISSFRGEAKFSTWLFQIARNVYRDALRKNKGWSYISIEETDELTCELVADSADSIEMEEVRNIVAGLPLKMKEVIVLRYYHDLNIREISDVLGCSEGTVKSRTFRALGIIRRKREILYT
ncbi:sigma-70 family RNA polymerase sigma factor [bacterium]|nr:sigma-70 family RNA polymerase sigma factor [bacterium]